MQSSPPASDETGDTKEREAMSKMKEQTWLVLCTGTSLQGEMFKHIDFPNTKMALDYIRQMPYEVRDASADVHEAIHEEWTDDGKKPLFDDPRVQSLAETLLDDMFTNARNDDEEQIIDTLQRIVAEGW